MTTFSIHSSSNAQDLKLETTPQKAGYIIGRQIGGQFKRQGLDLDLSNLLAGIKSAMADEKSAISPEDEGKVMQEVQAAAMANANKAQAAEGAANVEKGKKFLEENGKRKGVTTTPSGLQYEVLKEGTGKKPTADNTVKVHYHGTLVDGKVFDSSVDRGEPIEFPLNGVIKGWTEGVQLMPIGSKFKFVIPADLAYGQNGPPGIGSNSTLIFEVELLDITK